MITRLYVDNFRCLVNFELKLGRLNLLLGANGSGKTTVFEVVRSLRDFVSGELRVDAAFPAISLCRWQTNRIQKFEMELQIKGDIYLYSLFVGHDESLKKMRVKQEVLSLEGRKLFEFEDRMAQLYHDDHTPGPKYPFDWTQSGVGSLSARPDNTKLTRFKEVVKRIVVAGIYPMAMNPESRDEQTVLARNMANFASWYRYLSQEHQGKIFDLAKNLRNVLPGFDSFSLKESGEDTRILKVLMAAEGAQSKPITFGFDELSDGQRVLVALYALLYGSKDQDTHLFLDEPDNYLALREVQPWLTSLADSCGDGIEQAVIISHHPEVIDYLAGSGGRWFDRLSNGPVRVTDKPAQSTPGLKISEATARGWN